jgi:hypothetical protein
MVFFGALFVAAAGLVVMLLWNALIPQIFNANPISYVQALGILILARVLVGGRSWSRHRKNYKEHWKQKMKTRWDGMSETEREAFRAKMSKRCSKWADKMETEWSSEKAEASVQSTSS